MTDLQAPGMIVTRLSVSVAMSEVALAADYEDQTGSLPVNRYQRTAALRARLRDLVTHEVLHISSDDFQVVVQPPGC